MTRLSCIALTTQLPCHTPLLLKHLSIVQKNCKLRRSRDLLSTKLPTIKTPKSETYKSSLTACSLTPPNRSFCRPNLSRSHPLFLIPVTPTTGPHLCSYPHNPSHIETLSLPSCPTSSPRDGARGCRWRPNPPSSGEPRAVGKAATGKAGPQQNLKGDQVCL